MTTMDEKDVKRLQRYLRIWVGIAATLAIFDVVFICMMK